MAQRWRDWLAQAEHDLEQAAASRNDGRHDWACFASHQAAEKAVKALQVAGGQRQRCHVIARLLLELPDAPPKHLIEKGQVLETTTYRHAVPGAMRKGRHTYITGHFRASRDYVMPVTSFNLPVNR